MGRYADTLAARARMRRIAKRAVKWPAGFEGGVMWCPQCTAEVLRIPSGTTVSNADQQRAVDAHNEVCVRRNVRLVATKPEENGGAGTT